MGKIAGKISLIEARLQKLNQNDDYTEQLFIVTPLIIFFFNTSHYKTKQCGILKNIY